MASFSPFRPQRGLAWLDELSCGLAVRQPDSDAQCRVAEPFGDPGVTGQLIPAGCAADCGDAADPPLDYRLVSFGPGRPMAVVPESHILVDDPHVDRDPPATD